MSNHTRLVVPALGLLLAVTGALAPVTATAAPESPITAAAKKGSVKVIIKTPQGVPATLQLLPRAKPAKNRRTLTKSPQGTKSVRRTSLPAGQVTVVARDIVRGGKLYRATTPKRITVRAGRTTALKVTYRLARTAPRALTARSIQSTRVALSWQGAGGTSVRLVRTTGTKAATTVRAGRTIKVTKTGATDSAVAPGTSYTYALFTRLGKQWAGPVTTTVGTPHPGRANTTTYLLSPDTRVLATSEITSARYLTSGAVIRTNGPTPLLIGQVVGLPATRSTPQGFLGRVHTINADGTATATPVSLGEAFDQLVIRSHLASAPRRPLPRPTGGATRSTLASGGDRCTDTTTDADGIEAEVDPVFDLTGDFNADMITSDWLKVPIGAKIDGALTATLGLAFSIDTDAEAACAVEFEPIVRPLPTTSPVPILLTFVPHIEVSTQGRVALDAATVSASATMSFDAEMSLNSRKGSGHWTTGLQAFEEPPTFTASAQASVDFGGALIIGPGAGTAVAGATAGLKGTLNPLSLSASATVDSPVDDLPPVACLSLAASGNAKVGLSARAWLGKLPPWEQEFDIPGLTTDWDYARLSFPVECAGARSQILVIDSDGTGQDVVTALEDAGYSVATTEPWASNGLFDVDLLPYEQVWFLGQYDQMEDLGPVLHDYVKAGGSLMLSGDPTGRPQRAAGGGEPSDLELNNHSELLNSLLKTPGVEPAWLPHFECTICWTTANLPLEGSDSRWGIDWQPHSAPDVAADWEYFYRDVPERNIMVRTDQPNQALATIWPPADLKGNGEGMLVTIATSQWHDDAVLADNVDFVDNVAHYLTGDWQILHHRRLTDPAGQAP